jgi:hypothetical protein
MGLMFVLYIIRCSRNNQHYALICTTPLFYILAPICFNSSLPSSGSSWIYLIYLKYRSSRWYIIQCVVMWHVCQSVLVQSIVLPRWVVCTQLGSATDGTKTHRPHNHTLCDIPPIWSVFQVTQTDSRSSLMMADYCRNM